MCSTGPALGLGTESNDVLLVLAAIAVVATRVCGEDLQLLTLDEAADDPCELSARQIAAHSIAVREHPEEVGVRGCHAHIENAAGFLLVDEEFEQARGEYARNIVQSARVDADSTFVRADELEEGICHPLLEAGLKEALNQFLVVVHRFSLLSKDFSIIQ